MFKVKVAPETDEENKNKSAEQDLTVNTSSGWFLWLIVVGFLLFIFSFFTNNWHVEPTKWSGLWMVCGTSNDIITSDIMEGTHALMVTALVFYCGSYAMLMLYLFSEPQCVSPKVLLAFFFIGSFLATIFIVAALLTFGLAVKDNLSFSFYVEGISALFSLCTSLLSVIHLVVAD